MTDASRRILVLLFLVLFSWTSQAETLPRRYGYEKLFQTGTYEQLNATFQKLDKRFQKALKKEDYKSAAVLCALASETLETMGDFLQSIEYGEMSLEIFNAVITKDLYRHGCSDKTLLLRYDYAATLIRLADLYVYTSSDLMCSMKLYNRAMREYDMCMLFARTLGTGELGDDRLRYIQIQRHKVSYFLSMTMENYARADEAVDAYMKCVEEYYGKDYKNYIEYARALGMKASVCICIEDYNNAIKYYESAIQASSSIFGHASVLNSGLFRDLGIIYSNLNDYETSYKYLNDALDIYIALGMRSHPYFAKILQSMAIDLCYLGLVEEANDYLDIAYKIFVDTCGEDCTLVNSNRIRKVYTYYIPHNKLREAREQLYKYKQKKQISLSSVFLETEIALFMIAQLTCDYEEVLSEERTVREYLSHAETPSIFGQYQLYLIMAQVFDKVGKPDKAQEYFALALDLQRQMVHKNFLFLSEDQRELFWSRYAPRFRNILKHSLKTKEGGSAHSALLYDAALLQKGLLLEASINLARIIDEKGSPELKAKMHRLRLLMMSVPSEENIAEAKKLEMELVKEAGELGDFVNYADIRWEDVKLSLADNEVAIEFLCVEDNGEKVYTAEVLRRDMDYPYHLEIKRGEAKFNWQPILHLLRPGDSVYFSPVEDFHLEGIEYMTLSDELRMDEKYNMYRVSSTRELVNRNTRNSGEQSIVLYGGLNYSASQEDMELRSMVSATRGDQTSQENRTMWPYLYGTEKEIDGIAAMMQETDYKCVTISGDYGAEEAFKKMSGGGYDIIHIATHGFYFHSDKNALNHSGLILAGANNNWLNWSGDNPDVKNANDGILTSAEIADMNLLGTDLVVLSACNTGLGRVSGEGVYGLQRAFKKAGVQSLLVSLTEVDDEITNQFMLSFYKYMLEGKTKHSALRLAQEDIRRISPDPANWTSFILID